MNTFDKVMEMLFKKQKSRITDENHMFFLTRRKKKSQKIVMTLLVRDEADIVRDNIEFHLNHGVDFIVAMDNNSIDGTTDILHEYDKLGTLHYIFESSTSYLQDVWVTRLARVASIKYSADWVINGDADEFYISLKGSLKKVLANIPTSIGAITVKRHDMVPIARKEEQSPIMEMIYRKQTSKEWVLGHPIVDKIIHRGAPDIEVARGSHAISSKSINNALLCDDIITFHYPIRSFSQFKRKVENVGFGRHENNLGESRYDYWYSALLDGKLEDIYLNYQLDKQQIQEGIANGDIVKDCRLADFFTKYELVKQFANPSDTCN